MTAEVEQHNAGGEPRVVDSAEDFATKLVLRDVGLYEISARQRERDNEDTNTSADMTMWTSIDSGEQRFRVDCRLFVDAHRAEFVLAAVAIYDYRESVAASDDITEEFARNTALPVIYPYLRAELPMIARRIGRGAPKLPPTANLAEDGKAPAY